MRLCDRDWDKVRRAFGFEEIEDVTVRLHAVTAAYGFDPWLATNIRIIQRLVQRKDLQERFPNPHKFQEVVGGEGCPVCFARDPSMLDAAIEDVKAAKQARDRQTAPARPRWAS